MKSRRKKICVAVTAVVIVGLGIWQLARQENNFIYEGKRLSVWFDGLMSRQSPERSAAEKAFKDLGPKAVPFLIDRLKERDSDLKHRYTQFYNSKILTGPKWLRACVPEPKGHNAEFRRYLAAGMLGKMGAAAAPAIPNLAKMLANESRMDIIVAGQTLIAIGTNSASALPQLAGQLGHNDPSAADHVAYVIRMVAKNHSNTVPTLVAVLSKSNDTVTIRALRILPELGPNAKAAERQIESFLKAPNRAVRFAAVCALWDLATERHEELFDTLAEFATSPDKQFHEQTCHKLLAMKPLTSHAAALAVPLAEKMESAHRWGTYYHIANRGSAASNAAPVLIAGLKSEEPRSAAKAAEALGKTANPTPEVIKALHEAQQHEYLMVRDAAEEALKALQSRSQP